MAQFLLLRFANKFDYTIKRKSSCNEGSCFNLIISYQYEENIIISPFVGYVCRLMGG